jgi:PAS domain S-box-containing protein
MSLSRRLTGALTLTAAAIGGAASRHRQTMSLATRLTAAVVVLVAVTAAAIGFVTYRNVESAILPGEFERAATQVRTLAFELETYVQTARGDAVAFRAAIGLAGIMRASLAGGTDPLSGMKTSEWLGRLGTRFTAELTAKPAYAQFRVIGIADGGREILRVDRSGPDGKIRRVPDGELQRKGDRGYFKEAIRMQPDEVYVSEIDLNQEQGVIETPYVPTLRVATVILSPSGDPFGIIIINLDLRPAFDRLRATTGPARQIFVVNDRGDYLVHPDRNREFGFDLGKPVRWQQDLPEFAAALGGVESGVQLVRNSLGHRVGAALASARLANGPRIGVMETIPYAELAAPAAAVGRLSIIAGVVAVLLSAGLALLLARSLTRPLAQMTADVERFAHDGSLPMPTAANGEIGVLARAFARMAADVRVKTQALKREVSEHRRTEAALDQQAARTRLFAAAVNSSQDAIVTKTLDGVITGWNPAAERMFGYTAEEAIGRNINIVIPSERRDEETIIMKKLTAGKRVDHFETTRLHKDGRPIDVSISISPVRSPAGAIVGASKIARDITEAKKAHQAVAESEQMARGIIATALDAFVQMDDVGRIREWNPQAEKIFGWSREEAMDKTLADLIVPERHRAQHVEGLSKFLRTGEGALLGKRFEIEATCKDGREIKVEVAITALHRRDGLLFNGFIRDLTEKTQAEEQLRRSQRMEAIGQLTGGIAHDFNNILTVITGTIEILAGAVAGRPKLVEIAKMIDDAAGRGAELTSRLLAFARRQPLKPKKVDVNALIIEAAMLLRPTLGEQIEIESMLEDDVWPAFVDASELTTGLLNLAVNARDAMPGGGKLTLETGNVFLDDAYAQMHGDVTAGEYVMVAVSDTGTGIPAAIRDRVFEPFFTTKAPGKGTGLGLSMVYGFVKQSGGHIKIYSEEGHGTTIRIYLPHASGADEVVRDMQRGTPILGRGETILVVEDDSLVRNYVVAQLETLGYTALATSNALKALELVDGGSPFDLLFTDVIMPGGMNGKQLFDELVRRRGPIKVLYTSGYTQNAIVHHGRLDPGVLLLAKPYRKSELARMVRTALDA